MAVALCPRCNAPRADGPECLRCGVIYAKVEARTEWDTEEEDLERRLRIWAIPVALVVMRIIMTSDMLHSLLRMFLSMWVHETGHAVTAWLCGFPAFPGPWLTPTAQERHPIFALLVGAALAAGIYWSWRKEKRGQAYALGAVLLVQLCGTLLLKAETAQQVIYFGGDAGCFVLGTLLMATVYAPRGSKLHADWLRWGFLVIGAAAFMDVFELWWAARTDIDRIPFGMNEGVGLSDPSVLSERFGWSAATLVHRYVLLGCTCLAALGALWLRGYFSPSPRSADSDGPP